MSSFGVHAAEITVAPEDLLKKRAICELPRSRLFRLYAKEGSIMREHGSCASAYQVGLGV